jgi:uncharacterized damage-inducible protein DinB
MDAPQFPAGPFEPEVHLSPARRAELVAFIERAPAALRAAVAGLTEAQLDTKYRNWTIRQIVHHIADSHLNSFIRFKWALTEEHPTIKAYNETLWAELPDARTGAIDGPLVLLEGLHATWVLLLRAMSETQFARGFLHPETGRTVTLNEALSHYAWHGRHHTGQILWLRERHGWGNAPAAGT